MTAVKLKVIQETQPATTLEFLYHQDLITIGREPDNLLQLPDQHKRLVSRHHAQIERVDDAFHVLDHGSMNGTYVNDEKIEKDLPRVLQNGDRLKIGDYTIHFFALTTEPEPEPEPPTDINPFVNEANQFARVLIRLGEKFAYAENGRRLANLQAALAEPLRQLAHSDMGAVIKTVLEGLNGAASKTTPQATNETIDAKLRETQSTIQVLREENRQLHDAIHNLEARLQNAMQAASSDNQELAAKWQEAQAGLQALREENQRLQASLDTFGVSVPNSLPALSSHLETARLSQVLDLLLEAAAKMIAGYKQSELELTGTILWPPNFATIYKNSSWELKKHLLDDKTSEQEKTEILVALKQVLNRVIAHQAALWYGYRKCVQEIPKKLLQLVNPDTLAQHAGKNASEKKLLQAIRDKHRELMKEDLGYFDEEIFRPAFLKGYHERMDSAQAEGAEERNVERIYLLEHEKSSQTEQVFTVR
jgi:pSer/pThr/pTyr-binding forkhead associated (FHA) protein